MSREFGECMGGCYMHSHVLYAAQDCEGEDHYPITKLLGTILNELYPLAYAVASHEAADAGPDDPLFTAIQQLPRIRDAIKALEAHVRPYQDVAERAIRSKVKEEAST